VHKLVETLEVILFGCGAEVALIEEVALEDTVEGSCKEVGADVKLPLAVEVGILDVFLDDEGASIPLHHFDLLLDFLEATHHRDAVATVGVLARFADPDVFALVLVGVLVLFCLTSVKALEEERETGVIHPILDDMGFWEVEEDLFVERLVVLPHVGEEQFFGVQVEAPRQVVVHE
jgi:hypothetical protein